MSISTKSRKVIWARSGNCCAICRTPLVSRNLEDGQEFVLGQECHIVSSKANGPRHVRGLDEKFYDSTDNLILLCPNHHIEIDSEVSKYSTMDLIEIKEKHEEWVTSFQNSVREKGGVTIVRPKVGTKFEAQIIQTGSQLASIVFNCHDYIFDWPENLTSNLSQILSSLVSYIDDFDVISIDPKFRITWSYEVTELIDSLESEGCVVLAARIVNKIVHLEGNDPWHSSYIKVIHSSEMLNYKVPNKRSP